MIIIRNASAGKSININGNKELQPDEFIQIEKEEITPGVRALINQGILVLSKKEIIPDESKDILKELDEEKEVENKGAVAEEPEAVVEEPVKKTTSRKKKAE